MRTLVIGGARSGKSLHAERLVGDGPVEYVATAARWPDDPEWVQRVALHQARRPASWATTETLDVPAVLAASGPTVLVDCLTVWLSRTMDAAGCWPELPGHDPDASASALASRVDALVAAVAITDREVVLVSNEVGQGVVPATASARLFRDQMGILNARIAAACDAEWFVTAGIPARLK